MSDRGPQNQPDEALVDLLIKQVTEGLSPAEQRALDALDSAAVSEHLAGFERAAAAVTLAGSDAAAVLPAALRSSLAQRAAAHVATLQPQPADHGVVQLDSRRIASRPAVDASTGIAGWIAAAACLLLAVYSWKREPQLSPLPPVADITVKLPAAVVAPVIKPPEPPTAAQQRDALLANADSLKVTLGATKDPAAAGVTGDVVWDPVTQKGFIHLTGLAANDPQTRQYQMWIFDGERDKRYPVDAGLFDVSSDGAEVLIPIHAAVPIRSAKAFAVTLEKAGGVVVSGLEHVIVLGKAG